MSNSRKYIMPILRTYTLIDCAKFVCAFLVVAIHTTPLASWNFPILNSLSDVINSLAVPFFFMASGFLLWNKCISLKFDLKQEIIFKYIRKILKLYVIWTIIYLPLTCIGFSSEGLSFSDSILIFIRNLIFVGQNYLSWPLWYLLGTIVAMSIVYLLLVARLSTIRMLFIAIFMYLLGIIMDVLHNNDLMSAILNVYYKIFQTTRNGFFVGLLYVVLGMFIAEKKSIDKTYEVVLLFLLGVLFVPINKSLALPFIMYSIFSVIISTTCYSFSDELSLKMRNMSSIIYFVHMYWVAMLIYFPLKFNSMINFMLVSLLSSVTALLLIKFRSKRFYRLLFN